ncbi:MAG: RsmD family RNA methyltransferase [Flavobacteriales bacterium]|nr:RsmD family RNA methyltransferase [Flavobacteriales bacterium]
MRILGGSARGRVFTPPTVLRLRPTTDRARESLFQLIENQGGLQGQSVLDLCCGTGSIGLECASRGAHKVICIDIQPRALSFIAQTAREFDWPLETLRADVIRFLRNPGPQRYNFVFADPPYEARFLPELPHRIQESGVLQPNGLFILEHGPRHKPLPHPGLEMERTYGHVHFSFYRFG